MTDNETPEQTPAQRHYAAAEYALDLSKEKADPTALIAQAQVHATLAQAASNEALLQFVEVLKQYLGGTTYNVSVANEASFARDVKRQQQRWQGGV